MARTVAEAMTAPAITVEPDASVARAARLMSEHGVNRLPVIQRGSLVGIVTRADLVRAFTRADSAIKLEIEQDVLERTLWDERHAVDVVVSAGVVKLRGMLETKSDAELLERLSARVPGVIAVEPDLRWAFDDTSRSARRSVERSVR
jgi:predicted transcriptional regulator